MLPMVRQMLQAMSSLKTIGGGGQEHPDGATHDGGHQDAEGGGLHPSHHHVAAHQKPDPPQQEGREQPGQQPGQQHVGRGELGVQAAGHQQNRHPDDRREQTEIGVGPSVVDEPLDAQGSGGQRQMAVEHGTGLKVVEVVLVHRGTQQIDRTPQATRGSRGRERPSAPWPSMAATTKRRRPAAKAGPHRPTVGAPPEDRYLRRTEDATHCPRVRRPLWHRRLAPPWPTSVATVIRRSRVERRG